MRAIGQSRAFCVVPRPKGSLCLTGDIVGGTVHMELWEHIEFTIAGLSEGPRCCLGNGDYEVVHWGGGTRSSEREQCMGKCGIKKVW